MKKYDNIKKEIDELVEQGTEMYNCFSKYIQARDIILIQPFLNNYERWYSKALLLVKQILPQRYDDFILKYRNEKRKEINQSTYTILDALNVVIDKTRKISIECAAMPLYQQIEIVKSCKLLFESEIYNMQVLLQAEIFDSEIDSAKHLLRNGFLRAAGAVCGVVIEKHLGKICENRGIVLKKENPVPF